jgi:hypothetical protein
LTLSVELPAPPGDRLIDVWLNNVLGPEEDTETERLTVPLNPFILVKVRLNVPEELRGMVMDEGLPEIEKSGTTVTDVTATGIVVECEIEPLVPVTIAV